MARAREAENLLRANLAIRLGGADPANSQATVHVPSRLAGALVAIVATDATLEPSAREAKLCEAEKLLLQSQQVIGELERSPAGKKIADKYQKDGLDRLVRLYQWWGKPKKAESFQRQLNNFGTPQSKPNASGLAERSR